MKQKIQLTTILHILSVLAFLLSLTPFLVASQYFIFHNEGNSRVYLQELMLIGIGFFAYFLSFLLELMPKINNLIKNIIKILIGIICFVGIFILFFNFNWILAIIIAILSAVAYYFSTYNYDISYDQVYTTKLFNTSIILNILCIIVPYLWASLICQDTFTSNAVVFPFLLFAAIYFLVKNQANIDWMMTRRKHNRSHLPLKIRSYNIILVSVFIAIIVLAYIFRGFLASILSSIISFFQWIGSLAVNSILNGLRNSKPGYGPSGGITGDKNPFDDSPPENDPVVFWICMIALIAVIILIVIYRKPIWSFICSMFESIYNFIKRKFKFIFDFFSEKWKAFKAFIRKGVGHLNFVKKMNQASEDYSDNVISLSPTTPQETVKDARVSSTSFKAWKKSYEEYNHLSDLTKKIRAGYRLIIDGLSLMGIKLDTSDTTLEILNKSKDIINNNEYPKATQGYNSARYGEKNTTKDILSSMEETLKALYVKLKGN